MSIASQGPRTPSDTPGAEPTAALLGRRKRCLTRHCRDIGSEPMSLDAWEQHEAPVLRSRLLVELRFRHSSLCR